MKIPLKRLREKKGITQLELSRDLGVVPSSVGMWEQGRRLPDYDNLKKIARYFGVTTDYLLDNETQNVQTNDETHIIKMYRVLNSADRQSVNRMISALCAQQQPAVAAPA